MTRLIQAFLNSYAAFVHLVRFEKAVQQEIIVLIVGIPLAFFITNDVLMRLLLISVLIFVLIIEILNTALEATCNALSRDFNKDIKIAKDCGSLAVFLAIALALMVWICTIWQWWIS
jgi:diacylglycerol kinase (ATP)